MSPGSHTWHAHRPLASNRPGDCGPAPLGRVPDGLSWPGDFEAWPGVRRACRQG